MTYCTPGFRASKNEPRLASGLRVRSVTKPPTDKSGDRALSGDQEYDLLYASAKNGGTTWTNDSFSTNSSMEFSGLKASASSTYGKPGDGKNAAAKVSSTIQIAHAELKANAFSGNNDDMIGTKAEIGAGYETMKGR